MATVAIGNSTGAAPQAVAARGVRSNSRVGRLRSWMLAIVAASVSFSLLAGFISWQANLVTYDNYRKIVDEGSVSVDSALRARAAVLDHMSAAATYLETTGANQPAAEERARERWAAFSDEARRSWQNLTDRNSWRVRGILGGGLGGERLYPTDRGDVLVLPGRRGQ